MLAEVEYCLSTLLFVFELEGAHFWPLLVYHSSSDAIN